MKFQPFFGITPQDRTIEQYYVGYPCPDIAPPRAEEVQHYYQRYPEFLRRMRSTAVRHGFLGEFIVESMKWWSPNEDVPIHYPAPPLLFPEVQAAKYYARGIVLHLGMDVTALVRLIPDFGNHETRTIQNLCTIMAGHEAIDMLVRIDIDYDGPVAYCAFRYANAIGCWPSGRTAWPGMMIQESRLTYASQDSRRRALPGSMSSMDSNRNSPSTRRANPQPCVGFLSRTTQSSSASAIRR